MQMPETFYRTGIHKVDYTTFGGIICFSDYCTNYKGKETPNGSSIANRIMSDWKFDKKCKKEKVENNNSKRKNWRE